MTDKAIIVSHMSKTFQVTEKNEGVVRHLQSLIRPKRKTIYALRDVSFAAQEGEVLAFIGSYNAGKTTLLKLLRGLLIPSMGLVHVLGYQPYDHAAQFLRKITLFQHNDQIFKKELSVGSVLRLLKLRYKIPSGRYNKTLNELSEALGVSHLLNVQIKKLSMSELRRIEFLVSFIHKPQLALLDEPFSGLDFETTRDLQKFLMFINSNWKTTIVITARNLDDVLSWVNRLIVLDNGQIIFDGESEELISEFSKEKFLSIYSKEKLEKKSLEKIGRIVTVNDDVSTIAVARSVAPVAAAEIVQTFEIKMLNIDEPSIEEIVLNIQGRRH